MDESDKQKYKSLCDEATKRVEGFIDFNDKNCDDCPGWDGVERRCACGNRRVYWELSDDKTYVYAQAW